MQPHQLLDFLGGRLDTYFVADAASLEYRLGERDLRPDRDGLFRINSFFCRANTWQAMLPRLVRGSGAVLMDLRSFTADNAGCIHELSHLVGFVPVRRCVLVVDDSTDQAFLARAVAEAWQAMPAGSPNRGARVEDLVVHRLGQDTGAVLRLLRVLCAAGQGPRTPECGGDMSSIPSPGERADRVSPSTPDENVGSRVATSGH